MIYLQFKTNNLKIGLSVPPISLNYGRNLAKRSNDGSGKGNSCRLFVQCVKQYMHFRPRYLEITEITLKLKRKQKRIQTNE